MADRTPTSKERSATPAIITGFAVLIFFTILFASVSLVEIGEIAELNNKIYKHPFSVSNAVLEANTEIISMHRYMKDVVLATNKDELETAILLVEKHEKNVYRLLSLVKERFLGNKETVDIALSTFTDWRVVRNEVIGLQRGGQHKKAAAITVGKGADHVQLLTERMNVLINFARSKAFEFKTDSHKRYKNSLKNQYFLLVFIALTSVGTAFFVINKVKKSENSKKESKERFEALFRNSEVAIWSEDFSSILVAFNSLRMEGVTNLKEHLEQNESLAWELAAMVKVNNVNKSAQQLFGAGNKKLFLSQIDKSFGADAIEVFIDSLTAIWNKEKSFKAEANFNAIDGRKIRAIVSFQIPVKENDFYNVPVSIVDITVRQKHEEQLKLSSRVFNNTHEGIMITGAEGLIVDVNPAFCEITGYTHKEVMGQNPSILSSGKQSPQFYAEMWQELHDDGHWQGEVWNRRKNGELYAELLAISILRDDKGKLINYVGVFSDITQSKQQQEKLSRMAHYDLLTGLPNREVFKDRSDQAIAHSKRSGKLLAICFLDLDNFKPVNDNYGHDVGDDLLVEVASRIKACIREEDTVSRQGGDEFTILLNNLESYGQCEQTLERVLHALAQPIVIDDIPHVVGASIGVTVYPDDDENIDTLIRHSDNAMYKAKQSGKQRYQFFDGEQDRQLVQKHHKLAEIQRALNSNEFRLYYQPKVNMATGELFGAEALIRWVHPDKGLNSTVGIPAFSGWYAVRMPNRGVGY